MVHDREPVAQDLGLLHVVGREQHGPTLVLRPRTMSHSERRAGRIETGGRLVEEDELGVVDERQRHGQPLPLPARELLAPGVAALPELEEVDRARRSGASFG